MRHSRRGGDLLERVGAEFDQCAEGFVLHHELEGLAR